ncbi:MAG: hypothetical protein AAF700_04880 [Pseudomonadota bacterium]
MRDQVQSHADQKRKPRAIANPIAEAAKARTLLALQLAFGAAALALLIR